MSQFYITYKKNWGGLLYVYPLKSPKDGATHIVLSMISIVYGSPAAGYGNKRAAVIGGLGR
jgi:hypothetical protein